MSDLVLKQLQIGPMANFVYLIGSRSTGECLVVDPAWDVGAIIAEAEQAGMTIKGALVTHFHPDHCGGHLWGHDIQGVAELVGALNVPVYVNKEEAEGVMKITGLSAGDLRRLDSGDRLEIGGTSITAIHTPGHTPGSQCFLCNGSLIAGDTLFLTGCGRVDLPGGDAGQLYHSLTDKISRLPNDTMVFPGHNYDTKSSAPLADVKKMNPYLGAASLQEWMGMFGNA